MTVYPLRDGILDLVGNEEVLNRAQMSSFAVHQSDELGRRRIDARLNALLSRVPSSHGKKPSMLLDVGGGYGDLAIAAASEFELVVSVNASLTELQGESAMLDAVGIRNVALIITSNLKFADWTQVFGDERLTAALLDRLTHHAHILELVGESYRFRQRLKQDQA